MNKKIANIVFYTFWDPTREEPMQQACIFYTDGTVKNVLYEEGQDLANEIAKEENLKTQAEVTNIINTKRIYTLSGEEFERRFKEFLGTGATAIVPLSQVSTALVPVSPVKTITTPTGATKTKEGTKGSTPIVVPPVTGTNPTRAAQTGEGAKGSTPIVVPPVTGTNPTGAAQTGEGTKGSTPIVVPPVTGTTPSASDSDPYKPRTSKKSKKKNKKNKKGKKKGLFQKLWVKVTAFVLAAAMFFTGGYIVGRNTKSGEIVNNNITMESQNEIPAQDQAYLNLLYKSTNEDQKSTMIHQSQSLDVFNRDFANAFIEEGKDIKASLTWDEMMALNLAYNTYTKEQIRIMFNGAEVDATAMSSAYRNATLQLMGAYVISTRENPVNSSAFLIDPEQQVFVEKYNNLFLTMKETTGAEQVAAIDAFYAELYKDFPISDEVREEGISHADGRAQVEAYKAAVTPMVMAAEIMFQNVSDTDHTLSDKAIAYFNDLGLCNVVDEQFKRAETITLTAETDETQPLYTEFRDAKITELIYEGNYPTDDAHRDLSQLEAFQVWVNGHFEIVDGVNTGNIVANPTTTTTTGTYTEKSSTVTSDRSTAVNQAGESAVKKAEDKVDSELEAQNKAAQEKAQQEADQASSAAKKEAEEDASDMQNKINDANQTINNGGTVNESDFGDHDVDFSDEFEDGNGNLSDSVTDITTDGTGAKTENDLPDPNQTGAVFDGQSSTGSTSGSTSTGSSTGAVDNSGIYEYEEPYYGMSNEEIVNAYIASLEGQGTAEAAKVYSK